MIVLLFISLFITWLWYMGDQPYGCKNKIKFKSFKSFYDVNPQRWNLYDSYVGCKQEDVWKHDIQFKFGFFDYFKYKRFYKNHEKMQKNMASNKDYARMIELVKSDIAALESQAKSEFTKGINDFNRILQTFKE